MFVAPNDVVVVVISQVVSKASALELENPKYGFRGKKKRKREKEGKGVKQKVA